MSGYNQQQQQKVPVLLPLKKKAQITINTPIATQKASNKNNDSLNSIIKDTISKSPISVVNNEDTKYFGQPLKRGPKQKMQQDKKSKEKKQIKKQNQFNKLDNEKAKQNQKMKSLIAQMLNSMSVKNLTQQLYPVSNQVIQQLLSKIQDQIAQLSSEADRKSSQNNLHIDKQLEVIRRQINHCVLIKQLYHEKMNYRNKIQGLQEQIINLRTQNRDLKLKVSRGIQSIQNYKHNLPCDRQKQLIQKLSINTQQLTQQKQMRLNLQKNIQSIIMNFKKLYDQADAARKIVTQKLKQVIERQKATKKAKSQEQLAKQSSRNKKYQNFNRQNEQDEKYINNYSNNIQQSYQMNKSSSKKLQQDLSSKRSSLRPKPIMTSTLRVDNAENKQKDKYNIQKQKKNNSYSDNSNNIMSLEQKIKKMRDNQTSFKKNYPA